MPYPFYDRFADCQGPNNSQGKDNLRKKVLQGQMLKDFFFLKQSENWKNSFEDWHFKVIPTFCPIVI